MDPRRHLRSASLSLLLGLTGLFGLGLGCANDDDGETDILECTGTCSCNPDTNTCSCSGGTDCTIDGGEGVTVQCEGNARCAIDCEQTCNVECGGTSGCDAVLADGSTGTCFGTGYCAFTCEGSCEVSCSGSASCTLACPEDGDCAINDCPSAQTCPDGTLACQATCP
jgi:hypothetical protein